LTAQLAELDAYETEGRKSLEQLRDRQT